MFLDDDGNAVLEGDGAYGFVAIVDDDDLVIRNARSTFFGGNSDDLDDGNTASGLKTRDNPGILGCSLPMDLGHVSPSTLGSPLPKIPWFTMVRVYSRESGETIEVKLIDLGPAHPPKAHAAIDLTIAAFEALGGDTDDGDMQVDFRILGGALHLPDSTKAKIAELRSTRILNS